MAPLLKLCFPFLGQILAAGATTPPDYGAYGWKLNWFDDFTGQGGTVASESIWNIIDVWLGVNNEEETYRNSPNNVRLSGANGGSLELIPWRDSSVESGWTSGRIESQYEMTPIEGGLTMVEAPLRFGSNAASTKQGIWPAFWLNGASNRHHGVEWPECGEIDVMENINGQTEGFGTAHCGIMNGGPCQEPVGLSAGITIPDLDYHIWRVIWNRQSDDWLEQSITWYMDGAQYHQITGTTVGNQSAWIAMAQSPLYLILNVAVGGNWVSLI
jgi:beta-glucanase (GH16 family)